MNIKTMLMRLQDALGVSDLSKLVLLPESTQSLMKGDGDRNAINLVVGYDGSPESHTALDLTLWIAHQTRIVTLTPVIVHAVYVVESKVSEHSGRFNSIWADSYYFSDRYLSQQKCCKQLVQNTPKTLGTKLHGTTVAQSTPHALRLLQQACQLAEEWGGAFDTHLHFGDLVTGLRTVVEAEDSALLALGCCSKDHPVVQQLQGEVNCPVLGIPSSHSSSISL